MDGVHWIPMSYDDNYHRLHYNEGDQNGYHLAGEMHLTKGFIKESAWKAGEGLEVPKLIYKMLLH